MDMFGRKLREWRRERDVSLRAMADQLGISAVYLSDIERGHRPPPVGEKLARIATLLGVPLSDLEKLAAATRKLIIDPKEVSPKGFEVAALLARRLETNDENIDEILEKLKKMLES